MAEIGEVEAALAAVVSTALAGSALAGARVYRGWPDEGGLEADLAGGGLHVTVAATDEAQATTRHIAPAEWLGPRVATLIVAVAAGRATFGGTGGIGQVAGVKAGGVGYAVRLGAADTPASVAAALAAIVPGGAAVDATVAAAGLSQARVGVDRVWRREVRREERRFRVVSWCGAPEQRDAAAALLDPALSAVPFVALPDGGCGRLRVVGGTQTDRAEGSGLWRRDLLCSVEYAVTAASVLPEMLWGTTAVGPGGVTSNLEITE